MEVFSRRALLIGSSALLAERSFAREGPKTEYMPNIIDYRSSSRGVIHIDIAERRLYLTLSKSRAYSFLVGVPMPSFVRIGRAKIISKATNPWWIPTARMRSIDSNLPDRVPPGPSNPLGSHALYLNWPMIRIHGNNDANSVGQATTTGCYRLFNEEIEFIFAQTKIGTSVYVR